VIFSTAFQAIWPRQTSFWLPLCWGIWHPPKCPCIDEQVPRVSTNSPTSNLGSLLKFPRDFFLAAPFDQTASRGATDGQLGKEVSYKPSPSIWFPHGRIEGARCPERVLATLPSRKRAPNFLPERLWSINAQLSLHDPGILALVVYKRVWRLLLQSGKPG